MKFAFALGLVSIPVHGFDISRSMRRVRMFKFLVLSLIGLTILSQFKADIKELKSWKNPINWGVNVARMDKQSFDIPERVYSFNYLHKSFNRRLINYYKIRSIPYSKIQLILTPLVPKKLRANFVNHLATTLDYAERYKIDPLWAISVMWTESHFKIGAESNVGAQGLMQIMPKTGKWLRAKLSRELSIRYSYRKLHDPDLNIHLGIYYLNKLLNRFKGNYVHATVAYNMGPNWVKRRLIRRGPVGVKNLYLDKVSRAYFRLAKSLSRATRAQSYKRIPQNLVAFNKKSKLTHAELLKLKVANDFSYIKYRRRNYVMRSNIGVQTYVLRSDGAEKYIQLFDSKIFPRLAYL